MAEKKMTEAAVLALVEEEQITASRGAELLGIPLQDFFALMHAHGLTLCDDTPQDIRQDLKDIRKVLKKNTPSCAGSYVRQRVHSFGCLR